MCHTKGKPNIMEATSRTRSKYPSWGFIAYTLFSIIILTLFTLSLLFNPRAIQAADRLLMIGPDPTSCPGVPIHVLVDEESRDIREVLQIHSYHHSQYYSTLSTRITDGILWSVMNAAGFVFGMRSNKDRCDFSRQYQNIRCHVRAERVDLDMDIFNLAQVQQQAQDWYKLGGRATFHYMDVRSSDECAIQVIQGHGHGMSLIDLLPFYVLKPLLLSKPIPISLGHVQDVHTDWKSNRNRGKNEKSINEPAVEASSVSLQWEDAFYPIFDITASNISANIFYGTEGLPLPLPLPLGGLDMDVSIQVPLPSVKFGDWTVSDLMEMMPAPAEDEGHFPKLGIVNVTDVSIHFHDFQNDDHHDDSSTFVMPNEFFSPLYYLTKEGGISGIDQTKIEALMKEALLAAIRKYVLGPGGEQILVKLHESSFPFVHALHSTLEEIISNGGQMIDQHLYQFMNALNAVLQKLEDDWSETIMDYEVTIANFTNDVRDAWYAFQKSAEDLGNGIVESVMVDVDQRWDAARVGVEGVFDVFRESADFVGSGIEDIVENVKVDVDQKWDAARAGAEGIYNAFKATAVGFGIEDIVENFKVTVDQKWDAARAGAEGVYDAFRESADPIGSGIEDITENVKSNVDQRWDATRATAESVYDAFRESADLLGSGIEEIVGNVKLDVDQRWNVARAGAGDLLGYVEKRVKEAEEELGKEWKDCAQDYIQALESPYSINAKDFDMRKEMSKEAKEAIENGWGLARNHLQQILQNEKKKREKSEL